MARNSGRRPAARPAARPSGFGTRSTHSSAPAQAAVPAVSRAVPAPSAASHPPVAAQPQQPGLFAQMASTAAGVAVGSSVGHVIGAGISGLFGGSSSAPAAEPQQAAPLTSFSNSSPYESESNKACDTDARSFTKCLDENNGNMQICDWYLQQLKACQAASKQY
ncbi:Mix17p ASCRUDRAFT_39195 [Ascoidea rubescens DSM 1968]|uniref:CHCH domain-containing protein n=1 Tax=Ascoidea rubescens DSM 1968 TaxID=1344418 RepID=A0A1D2VA41_9ASCO|nr:hypothetical protein ASCRUDRAFT_39195 [Ascoidea rubescens DSM 1968]ODV58532.1 hypothetical protein ASCRUDRAFT_39195 [Ascoidea rubescens DSM 1968]